MNDDISDLVKELSETKPLASIINPIAMAMKKEREKVTEENLDTFIYDKASDIIQDGVELISNLKDTIASGAADADTISAYSKLIASVSSSIDILNKVNLQKRKEKATKELKQIDQGQNANTKLLGGIQNQTNIIVATRDEVMQALVNKSMDIVNEEKEIEVVDVGS